MVDSAHSSLKPVTRPSVVYCTNIWSHHQAPICLELARLLGEHSFKMCLFEPVHEERKKLGWASAGHNEDWILGPPSSQRDAEDIAQMVCSADVAVLGACPQEVRFARAATGKLTLMMSERLWKKPFYWWRMLNPRFARGVQGLTSTVNRDNVHYLAMGAYAAEDVRRIGAYGNRIWNWAYFADVPPSAPAPRIAGPVRILWAGRMLNLKRVDVLLRAVARIRHQPEFGRLDIVGDGPERQRLLNLSHSLRLDERAVFHDSVSSDRIRQLMRTADIYVLPSDRREGWGVVANEAMSEGAVLVANEDAGSAKVLIEHGRTGFLFRNGDVAGLAGLLGRLVIDAPLRASVRQAAWLEMQRVWHPRVGAERLLRLMNGLLGVAPMPVFDGGPCSRQPQAGIRITRQPDPDTSESRSKCS